MIFAGCDIGSLTGKAVLIKDNRIISTKIIRVLSDPVKTAKVLMDAALHETRLAYDSITRCCATGYGRENIPFSNMNISEISCHGMGAHWLDNSIRTILDIGAEDSKIIRVDEKGRVVDFAMNDKCAAGTGRCLDKLSKALNLKIEEIGGVSLKSHNPVNMTNICSIYMELEVIRHLYERTKIKDIAYGIHDAVASRIAYLTKSVKIEREITMTGGVSRNKGMIRSLGKILNIRFKQLSVEPQLAGAVGAAVFAMKEETNANG